MSIAPRSAFISVPHSRLTFPDSFLDTKGVHDRDDLAKIKDIGKELAAKGEVRHPGNKLPRYYFALDRLNWEVPRLKNIWIYRSPYGFMPSWNRRELDSHRGQWPAGQVGLFGLLELLVCIENCLSLGKDVFVFPYAHGLGRSAEATLQALAFVGAAPALYDRETFEKTQRRQAKKQRRRRKTNVERPSLRDYEEEILDALHIRELDSLMEQGRALMVSEIAAPLRDFLDRIAHVLPGAIDRAFSACDSPAVPSFGREYFRRNHAELAGLLRLAGGSSALGGFQSFGPYQRLKSLYVQRWALKRRLPQCDSKD